MKVNNNKINIFLKTIGKKLEFSWKFEKFDFFLPIFDTFIKLIIN